MARYAIWDKTSPIITPIGEVLSANDWIERYPVAALPNITVVCSAGDINGGYFGTLNQMVMMYEGQGCDFTDATTDAEKLAVIEAWEDAMNEPIDPTESTPEERIAAALELANVMNMPVVNDDDPDEEEL